MSLSLLILLPGCALKQKLGGRREGDTFRVQNGGTITCAGERVRAVLTSRRALEAAQSLLGQWQEMPFTSDFQKCTHGTHMFSFRLVTSLE